MKKTNNIFNEQTKNNIQILFDKSVRYRLIDEYGLNCYEENENGLLLSLDYAKKDYVFNWVLGFGDKAEILSPLEVRAKFAKIVKDIFYKY